MVDASHEKEVRAKETIQQLQEEITNLSALVEQGAGMSAGQDAAMKELIKVRDDLQQENAAKETKAKQDQERIQEMHAKMAELETMAERMRRHRVCVTSSQQQAEQERERGARSGWIRSCTI